LARWNERRSPSDSSSARQVDIQRAREDLDGFGKRDAFGFHQERDDVAPGAAAEAVPATARRRDDEGGGLFLVERAEALVDGSGRLELDVLTHDLDDVGLVLDPGDDIRREDW
jgi:hypothetical protein